MYYCCRGARERWDSLLAVAGANLRRGKIPSVDANLTAHVSSPPRPVEMVTYCKLGILRYKRIIPGIYFIFVIA